MTNSVSYRLHDAAASIWEACLKHPFVTGIGDGTLAAEKFRHFMLQDYLYLFDYARVFALGVVKAREPELMRTFAANVDAILDGEMKIHHAYMKRLGITEEQEGIVSYPYTVEEGKYFMVGDNREGSMDSRTFGALIEKSIKGKLWIR